MSLIDSFRAEVEGFIASRNLTPTAFGVAVVGDPNFVFDLRDGREPRAGTIDKVRAYIATASEEAAA